MAVVGNTIFYFSIFLRLMWEFLDFKSEHGGSIYWPNNKIIDELEQTRAMRQTSGFRAVTLVTPCIG